MEEQEPQPLGNTTVPPKDKVCLPATFYSLSPLPLPQATVNVHTSPALTMVDTTAVVLTMLIVIMEEGDTMAETKTKTVIADPPDLTIETGITGGEIDTRDLIGKVLHMMRMCFLNLSKQV